MTASRASRRYTLRPLWKSARVSSYSNGKLMVVPVWKQRRPGTLTRIIAAARLADLIAAHLKRRKK